MFTISFRSFMVIVGLISFEDGRWVRLLVAWLEEGVLCVLVLVFFLVL